MFHVRKGPDLWLWVAGTTVSFAALLAALHALRPGQKRRLTAGITFAVGLFYALEFFLPAGFLNHRDPSSGDNILSGAFSPIGDFFLVVGAMGLGLGILNLATVNGRILVRGRQGWHNSAIFFAGLIGMATAGIAHGTAPNGVLGHEVYEFFLNGLYQSLSSTVFALLAFFIASAAFRAFRITSIEATLMMVTAFIVMLGNIGSEVVTGWIPPDGPLAFLRLDNMTLWIMTTVNMSAQRALLFGIAIGELAVALRIWLSLERGHFWDQEV